MEGRQVWSGRVLFGQFPGLISAWSGASAFGLLTGKGRPCAASAPDSPPAGPGHGRPQAASLEGWPGTRMGQGLPPTAHPARTADNSCSPVKGPLVLQVVFEDTVWNQKHSSPCISRACESRKFPVQLLGPSQPELAPVASALEATLCTVRCSVGEAYERRHPSGDKTGPVFHVSVVLKPRMLQECP